jgi:hypothetical protein
MASLEPCRNFTRSGYRMINWGRGLLVLAGAIAGTMAFVQPSWADPRPRRRRIDTSGESR